MLIPLYQGLIHCVPMYVVRSLHSPSLIVLKPASPELPMLPLLCGTPIVVAIAIFGANFGTICNNFN